MAMDIVGVFWNEHHCDRGDRPSHALRRWSTQSDATGVPGSSRAENRVGCRRVRRRCLTGPLQAPALRLRMRAASALLAAHRSRTWESALSAGEPGFLAVQRDMHLPTNRLISHIKETQKRLSRFLLLSSRPGENHFNLHTTLISI